MRANCVRVTEPAQSPEPKIAPQISDVNLEKVLDSRTIRSRNSLSAGKGIPFDADIHDSKECLVDLPDLVDTDDEGNVRQSPPIWPSLTNHPEHARFHWYDSSMTVWANNTL